jgi:putative ABC transport system substrate-binding protein
LDPTVFDKLKGLTRADGNIALVGQGLPPLAPKRLEIIRELIPGATTIAVLVDPDEAGHAPSETAATSAAAQALAMQIQFLEARTEGEVDDVFTALTHKPADALIVSPHPFFISLRTQLVAAAKLHAIPAVYPFSEDAEVGGLISYGNSNFDIYRQMASYTARILKGEKPGDLLAMQPAKISLTINLRTAKALGLTVPQSLLARADKVIE